MNLDGQTSPVMPQEENELDMPQEDSVTISLTGTTAILLLPAVAAYNSTKLFFKHAKVPRLRPTLWRAVPVSPASW